MDLQALLEPHREESPAGVDLDAEGEIIALDMLAKWGAPEEEPEWEALRSACIAALERSHDLRPAVYLTAALLHTQGLPGFAEGLQLLRGLLEQHWESLFPTLDEDGDALERSSALFNLTNYHKVLKPLRHLPLVTDRAMGRFSLQDIEIAEGKVEAPEGDEGELPEVGVIQAVFRAVGQEATGELEAAVASATEEVAAIEDLFRDHGGSEQAPDLSRLKEQLQRIGVALRTYLPEGTGAGSEQGMPDSPSSAHDPPAVSASPDAPIAPAADGEIRSRREAVAAMQGIARYFRRHEPSSPVPLLMERAQRLVDMDFLTILRDVAPDAVAQGEKLRGDGNSE
ncbi:type VI secretion system protein TssA [Halomonas campisalis]|uniref:Type VI secretion system protein TssA n=1 Tax=Billgrantia campisalis TaxID=74661 RepID=A0ABS9P8S5_9GAMM|nr:type VI secretion system protein TssA [Halomonas campisalis]MCG6657495.1 type VI secretion system protein TssA [Halomonas campisalis]MDR5863158.1 type VI secretion system protein TssA [Halomonas campisalis]